MKKIVYYILLGLFFSFSQQHLYSQLKKSFNNKNIYNKDTLQHVNDSIEKNRLFPFELKCDYDVILHTDWGQVIPLKKDSIYLFNLKVGEYWLNFEMPSWKINFIHKIEVEPFDFSIGMLSIELDTLVRKVHFEKNVDKYYQGIVSIDNVNWSPLNLNVSHFSNGDSIPEARTKEQWIKFGKEGKPAWCYYLNNPSYGKPYGKLYNWYAVHDSRGLAPKGWHVATETDWKDLMLYMGGNNRAGGKLKTVSGWEGLNREASNSSGFNALPAGMRFVDGKFYEKGKIARFWSTSSNSNLDAWTWSLFSSYGIIFHMYFNKSAGYSVRCVRNNY